MSTYSISVDVWVLEQILMSEEHFPWGSCVNNTGKRTAETSCILPRICFSCKLHSRFMSCFVSMTTVCYMDCEVHKITLHAENIFMTHHLCIWKKGDKNGCYMDAINIEPGLWHSVDGILEEDVALCSICCGYGTFTCLCCTFIWIPQCLVRRQVWVSWEKYFEISCFIGMKWIYKCHEE